jgi:Membrane bound O-acyl transferase family
MRAAVLSKAAPEQTIAVPARRRAGSWIGWMPLLLLPMAAFGIRSKLLPWEFMWLLAAAIFAGCKWQTWCQTWQKTCGAGQGARNWKRSASYLLLWPGMEPLEFFSLSVDAQRIPVNEWLAAIAKTLAGVALIWAGARVISFGHPLVGGWVGMVGLVLFLHFGTFHLLALAWQRAGIPVKPIMRQPLASRSLSELWGKRWNLGFRKLSHSWVFEPLHKRFGPVAGTLGAFFASGFLHDLVISVPARAGYGLPTAYFLLQGMGVIAERSETGRRFGLGGGARGLAWTVLIALAPLYALFHPWFVMRVIVPLLRAVAA